MSERHELPASESPRASVLIAAFNPSTFGECLRSLAAHLPEAPSCEVIATLNGPTDALLDSAAGVTGLRTVDTPVNLGLAAGANLARSRARGELMVLVQDDAEIESGWLETLVAAADAHPEAGAVGGMVTWPGGERVQTAGLVLWNDCSHSEVGAGSHPDDWAGSDPFAVDYCSSSSLLVRAETWDAVGGLDDSFFPAGHVDADLAMRIRRANRAVLVEPRARSFHRRGASSTKPFKRFIAVRNAVLFRERWGAELARTQEPPGERGAVEFERALGRAEERRSRCARRPATAPTGEPRVTRDIDPLTLQPARTRAAPGLRVRARAGPRALRERSRRPARAGYRAERATARARRAARRHHPGRLVAPARAPAPAAQACRRGAFALEQKVNDESTFADGVRAGIPFAIAGGLVALSFGVVAQDVGLSEVAAVVMSAIVFAGSAQFAVVAILAQGGGVGSAVAAAAMMNSRFLPMGVALGPSLPGGSLSRAAQGQTVVDASWALAAREDGSFDRMLLIGSSAAQYVTWTTGTAVGAIWGEALGDPKALGLDAVYPAFFVALLLNEMKSRRAGRRGGARRPDRAGARAGGARRGARAGGEPGGAGRPAPPGAHRRGRGAVSASASAILISGCAVITALIKASGPVLLGGRELPERFTGVIALMAPALLAALVVTAVLADADEWAIGAETAGVAAGGLVAWRTGSMLGCVLVAAVVTAGLRAL